MIELKNIGDRLTSIVSVKHYALGLLKMLDTMTQKDIANYVGVSQSKLSHIIQLLSDTYSYTPCYIVRYVKIVNKYSLLVNTKDMADSVEFIDIFKFDSNTIHSVFKDLNVDYIDLVDGYYKIDKLTQITIDALHNLEYRYKA